MISIRTFLSGLIAWTVLFVSCDDGRIPEKDINISEKGRVVKLVGDISGLDNWPLKYRITIAGFNSASNYAETSARIMPPSDGKHVEVIMGGIADDVETLELCAIDAMSTRIMTFESMEAPATTDTIVFDVGTLDLSMFAVIQDHLFTPTCANCHGGGSGNPAGNLNLMHGKSYVSLVDEASHKLPDVKRVQPGNAEESLLYQVVMEQHEGWGYNHYGLLTQTPVLRTIIKDWIDGGASR